MADEEQIVEAHPTKDFFITMLTKDIKLERAIIDLIDNSIDGAKKLKGDDSFEGLKVDVTVNETQFTIKDNCGGFSLDIAKKYAFMFGRPENKDQDIKNSVGRFGVGMKRSLFKIGNYFEVESKSAKDHFQINVDVKAWSDQEEWTFPYENVKDKNGKLGETEGTYITVTQLNSDVLQEFSSETFLNSLKEEIERTLGFYLIKGLKITLNEKPLKESRIEFLESQKLIPYYKEFEVEGVTVKIYAGIGEANLDLAGWYLYCNNRLVVEKDRSNLTGWDGRRLGESKVVKFHVIYAMFRGVVFFSSEDAKKLPMTTTKTGIDSNSLVYKAARHEMIISMLEVIGFLKQLESDTQRADVVTSTNKIDVIELSKKTYNSKFIYPSIESLTDIDEELTTVSFSAKKIEIKKVQSFFKVENNKDAGRKLLDYFLTKEESNL